MRSKRVMGGRWDFWTAVSVNDVFVRVMDAADLVLVGCGRYAGQGLNVKRAAGSGLGRLAVRRQRKAGE